jgi:hypothetical protein
MKAENGKGNEASMAGGQMSEQRYIMRQWLPFISRKQTKPSLDKNTVAVFGLKLVC